MDEIAFDLFCALKQKVLFCRFLCLFSIKNIMDEICPKWSYVNTHYVYIFQDLVAIEIK